MASEYFSTNMENGPQVKEALDKINKFYPELFSWIEINDTEIIDLKSPTTNSYIKDPGDYVIYGFSNGPTEIQDTLAPVLLSIRDGKWFVSVNGNIYGLDSSNNWVPFEFLLEDTILFIKGDTAPTKTDKVFWFDTSHYDGTEDQYIDLKYYDTTTNQWESIFENSTDNAYIKKSEFDSTNKQLDVYDYIVEKVLDSAGEYADFIRHKNNQLTLIHVTADEREQYAKIITEDELKDLIDNTYMPVLKKSIEDFISDLGTGEAGVAISNLENDYAEHIANHVTTEDIAYWNNKSDANHTHDYTNDDTMKISGNNIVSGIFDNARIPDDIKERYYKLDNTPENVFGDTTITDADRNSKYHNGNAFYYDTNDETTGEIIRTWYRIIDSTKIGTSEWADGISDFTAKETDLSWENITGHPTNLDEFGITNTLYTKTEIDTNIAEYNEYVNEATPIIEKYEEYDRYEYNKTLVWNKSTINTSNLYYAVCYGNDKFVAVVYDYSDSTIAYSTDGINWDTTVTSDKTNIYWGSICYGNGKYIVISTAQYSNVLFIYSEDGIHWTESTIKTSAICKIRSVCYGNGKFVAVAENTKYFYYSTDGINWTEGTISSTRRPWFSVCYGNGKFVAVAWNTNYFAYSTDGINWTESTISSTSRKWWLVNYCKDKFIAIVNGSNYFAYSMDGITWKETIVGDVSREWRSICYGNGKYIAVCSNVSTPGNYFAYSTDGINWTVQTEKAPFSGYSICYGNNKFVTTSNGAYSFYAIDFIASISAKKIGLQYKNGDITNYTDTMTGTNPQLDCIILTTDNKIYKTTFNNNSTYLKFDGSYYTTTNSAEPLGATMLEIKLPNDETAENYFNSRFASDYATMEENPNYSTSGCGICVTVNNTIQTINIDDPKCTIEYSTDGINFTYTKGNMINNVVNVGLGSTDKINCLYDTYDGLKLDIVYEYGGSYTNNITDTNIQWKSVTYGNDKFVAVGYNSSDANKFIYSNDGHIWNVGELGDSADTWESVCYGADKFVAFSSSGVSAHSTDGINWTKDSPPSYPWKSVCRGKNYFIAVSSDTTLDSFAYSTDGINWMEDLPAITNANEICYGDGKFVVVGNSNINHCAYSPDNIYFHNANISNTNRDWKTICYGKDKFVALAYNSNVFAYSLDAITWVEGNISITNRNWKSIAYGNGHFVAITDNSDYYAYSNDGITWYELQMEENKELQSICYSESLDIFVAIGNKGYSIIKIVTDYNLGNKSTFRVSYEWTGITEDNTSVLPLTSAYAMNTVVPVDTKYTSDTVFETDANYYEFSGWDKSDFVITEDTTISGIWTAHNYYSVSYSWSNAPSGVVLPETIIKLKSGDSITVDSTYTSSSIVDTNTNYYTFSGWDKSGSIIITDNTTISGIWTAHNYYSVSYSWSNAPSGVTLPSTVTKLKPNDTVTVDTTYTSSSEVDTDTKYYTFSGWDKSGSITITDNTVISGIWTAHDYYSVTYSWNNAPSGVTLPSSTSKLKPGAIVTVDTTYTSSSEVDTDTKYYTFSGWDKSGNITVNSNTVISGKWTSYDYYTVSYKWSNIPSRLTSTVPASITKLKSGDTVVVDTTYTNTNAKADIDTTWTESAISSTSRNWYSVCYGNGKYVAIVGDFESTSNVFAYSTDGINWTESTISSTSRYWRSVCYANDKFVIVARSSNYFAYSTNGINWTEGTISNTSRNWFTICYGNGKFVTVAWNSNYFAYSTNGINWTESTISSTSRNWYSICYGNGKFVAIAYNSNYFAYSTNGTSWIEKTISSTSRNWYSICYGNGKFVTVASNSNYFAYSTDGINWTESTISDTSRYWHSVCYGNGKFIAVADNSNYFAYNTDGINWTESTISNTSRNWNSICYGNGKFVTVAWNSNYFAYAILDPVYYTFSGWNKSGNITVNSNVEITGSWSDKKECEKTWIGDLNYKPSYVCYGNNKFVTVSNNSNYFIYSTDGIIWTEIKISKTSRQWQSVCYGNGKFIAVADNSNYTAYSTDGINWTENKISNIRKCLESVCYGNNKFVAIKKDLFYNSTNIFAYSTDGITWTEGIISSTNRNWKSICYGNGKFVIVARSSNYFAYSTNGINWTEGTISNTSRNWYSVCYGNDKFVTVAYNSNYFAYSTDGITWTESTISSTNRYWYSVCYGNGKFVTIVNGTNYFAYSTDGINWTEGILPTYRDWYSVCYGNGKFVAVANDSNYFAYSTDGINWTESNIRNKYYLNDSTLLLYLHSGEFCYADTLYVNIFYDSNYFAYSTDGINWSESTISNTGRLWKSICYGNGKFVAVAYNSKYFAYSTNGINWTEGTISNTSRDWYSVCYGNGKFVAVAYNSKYFAYSTNGINWTEGTISSTSRQWQSICYGNGKFVAVAYNSKYFAYSTDGITWTESTISSTSRNWECLCYGNDKFVAVANDDSSSDNLNNYFAYSTDGINWGETTISYSSTVDWVNVCYIAYGDNKYVAVGNRSYGNVISSLTSYYLYSTDGITWEQKDWGESKNISHLHYINDKFYAYISNRFCYFGKDYPTTYDYID